jgi:uncharacterized membrane protein YccC
MPARDAKELGKRAKAEPIKMSAVADDLRVYAGRRWPTMNHKWRKAHLASLLGMTERRVRSLYEADEAARLHADEEARIRALIEDSENRKAEGANRDAFEVLQARIARLEAIILAQAAQQDHGPVAEAGERDFGRRRDDVARPPRVASR